ncbi:molybdate ABC transporter substrate-binding protein [Labedella endophytica]|uniref:Molybdate ABC transporter substrate-binding protein n=1 Tax=Labedella endophytica TaxID=1523160 RepID=A0A3S1CUP9_9MICO|nr:molybdate ABC transporter substrate-binding protein [Labedella endophytica]
MRRAAVAVLALASLALAGCTATDTGGDAAGTTEDGALTGSVAVFAAASLEDSFTELARRFEEENPGVCVQLTFAGSSDLVTQLVEGAPADVFASADERTMATLTDEGLIGAGATLDFASNTLVIVTPPDDPGGVGGLTDLASDDVRTVVCAPQVPCGAATTVLQSAAGVDIAPVSEESSVTDVLGKVTSGEADAGLVYATDALAAGDAVRTIEVPEAGEAVNVYPIAPLADAANPAAARAFVDLVTGEYGRDVLASAGFGSP